MKKQILFKLIVLLPLIYLRANPCFSQNLISNPGFELHDTCPTHFLQFELIHNWTSAENTPDFFNSCEPFHIVGVPYNDFGYQQAHSGCSYAGIFMISKGDPLFREYMQNKLDSTLIPGTKYYISFYLSLAIGEGGRIAGTNKFGCKLSTTPYPLITDSMPSTNNQATFYTDSIITDTLNWVKISGSFIADSAYNYICFGNFFDNAHTQSIIIVGAPYISSYYYIDDVCLSTDSLTCVNVTDTCHAASPLGVENYIKNDLTIYPNPFSDYLIAENKNNNEELEMVIRDMDGRVLYRKKFIGQLRSDLSYLAKGMYFYEVRKKGRLIKMGKVVKI